MKRYFIHTFLFVTILFSFITIKAQTSVGENTILYVGSLEDEDDERYTRSVYLLDVERKADAVEIGHVNEFGSEVGWSPQGNYVHLVNYNEDGNRILTVYDVEAGEKRILTENLHDNECLLPAYWSADDRYLAYVTLEDEQAFMKLWDTTDDSVITMREVDRDFRFYRGIWSPDGRYMTLPTLNYESTILWDTVSQSEIATLPLGGSYPPEPYWSSDDHYLIYQEDVYPAAFSIFDMVTSTTETVVTSTNRLGRVSSNNRYVVLPFEDDDTVGYSLHLHNFGTTDEIIIGERATSLWDMGWAVNSDYLTYIAFTDEKRITKSLHLYAVATDETRTILAEIPLIRDVVWSPTFDIFAIVYVPSGVKEEPGNIAIYDVETDTLTELDFTAPATHYYITQLDWTPDGQQLAVQTSDHDLFLYDVSSGDTVAMSTWVNEPSFQLIPPWSQDGKYMLFDGLEHGNLRNLYAYDLDENDVDLLLDSEEFARFIGWRGTNKNSSLIYCGEG